MEHKSKNPIGRVIHLNTVEADATPDLVELEPGGRLEWKNNSSHCPHFEIMFEGSSPATQNDRLTGTLEQSVAIHMPKKDGEFFYKVRYKRTDGTLCKEDPIRAVRTCPGGQDC